MYFSLPDSITSNPAKCGTATDPSSCFGLLVASGMTTRFTLSLDSSSDFVSVTNSIGPRKETVIGMVVSRDGGSRERRRYGLDGQGPANSGAPVTGSLALFVH